MYFVKSMRNLKNKLIKALFFGHFEPIQTTLSASSFIHGIIILMSHLFSGQTILNVNSGLEVFAGSSLVLSGVSVMRSICKDYTEVRRFSFFGQFLAWTLLSILVLISPGLSVLLYVGYSTLSLIAAFLYLNLSLGVRSD
jgi:hypothetical protein